jgi:hypothetical protein
VARLIEVFGNVYSRCRTVVTDRIVGYGGAACLGDFTTTTIRDALERVTLCICAAANDAEPIEGRPPSRRW